MSDNLADLQTRLERQFRDQERGKDMGIAIRTTNEQIEALDKELTSRRASLARRKVTALEGPRVVGVAAVLPGPVPAAVESWRRRPKRLRARPQWSTPCATSAITAGCRSTCRGRASGYDMKSVGPDGEVRYIEVKGHQKTGDIILYYTEWQTAHRMRDEFYIYVVDYALTEPQLTTYRDPVGQGIEPEERVVEYRISKAQLMAAAHVAEGETIG